MRYSFKKNIGPFLAFDKMWFIKHQYILLSLLNFCVTKYIFRFILRITKDDVSYSLTIVRILPNCYTVKNVDGTFSTDFRSHHKYAKRIYFLLRPVWWLMHFWDYIFADIFVPQLSFGFSVLTVYPDADPETTTVDGDCYKDDNTNWTTTRNAATSVFSSDSGSGEGVLDQLGNGNGPTFYGIKRGFILFDTSSLVGKTITSAIFSVYGQTINAAGSEERVCIVSSNPASNTAISVNDYNKVGSVLFGTTPVSYLIEQYNDVNLNSSGLANISLTGVSKFGLRTYNDFNNITADNSNELAIGYYSADNVGTSKDPKLVVTYQDDFLPQIMIL